MLFFLTNSTVDDGSSGFFRSSFFEFQSNLMDQEALNFMDWEAKDENYAFQ